MVIILTVLVILALLLLLFSWLLYRIAFATGKAERGEPTVPKASIYAEFHDKMAEDTYELKAEPYEPLSITASDGTLLSGRYYHLVEGAPLIIFFHGWRGHALRDGCIGFRIGKDLGFNVLLPDQRGHGKSGGKCTTMGVKERDDAASWAVWATERFPETDIVLMGVSMGGATVLMASDRNLPKEVKAIVADCGFTSPKDILSNCIPIMLPHLPIKPCYALGRLGARIFGHFDPNLADSRSALSVTNLPVLFLHGEADSFVPPRMSKENYNASASPKRIVTFPGAPHSGSFYKDPERYRNEVAEFLSHYVNKRG